MLQTALSVIKTYALGTSVIAVNLVASLLFTLLFHGNSYLISGCTYAVVILFCIWFYRFIQKRSDPVQSISFSWKNFIAAIVFWVLCCFMLITVALYINSLTFDPEMASRTDYFAERTAISPVLQVLFSCILAPVTEELMFRLCIYNTFRRSSPWFVAMFISAFLFGAIHGTLTHIVYATLFGCILVLIYENTGRHIAVTMLCHCIYNTIVTFSGDGSIYPYDKSYISIAYIILLVLFIIAIGIRTNRLFCQLDHQNAK